MLINLNILFLCQLNPLLNVFAARTSLPYSKIQLSHIIDAVTSVSWRIFHEWFLNEEIEKQKCNNKFTRILISLVLLRVSAFCLIAVMSRCTSPLINSNDVASYSGLISACFAECYIVLNKSISLEWNGKESRNTVEKSVACSNGIPISVSINSSSLLSRLNAFSTACYPIYWLNYTA